MFGIARLLVLSCTHYQSLLSQLGPSHKEKMASYKKENTSYNDERPSYLTTTSKDKVEDNARAAEKKGSV